MRSGTAAFFALLAGLGSCRHEPEATPGSGILDEPGPPLEAFRRRIDREGTIVFRSWEGRFIGTDCDWDLQFLPEGRIKMIENGEGVEIYRGTYRMDDRGTIETSFDRFPRPWPAMVLERDARSLFLRPRDAWYGGPEVSGRAPDLWPFRPISPEGKGSRFHD
jgi:hypothetical protein